MTEILDRSIQLFILVYGGVFAHLGILLLVMHERRKIHLKTAFLLLDFSIMCLSGAPSLYLGLKNVAVNYLVFAALIGQVLFGMDFLLTSLGLDSERKAELRLTRWASIAMALTGGALFVARVPTNLIYASGYLFLALSFSAFLAREIRRYLPLRLVHPALRRFFMITMLNILLISGMMGVQLSGFIDLMAPFWVVVIFSIFGFVVLFFRNPGIFHILETESKKSRYRNPRLTPVLSDELMNRVESLMEKGRPFLDPELRLSDLAQELNVTPHELSEFINTRFDCGFVQFVNRYRVGLACASLKADSGKSILDIAFGSGFNSKSAFNKAFKEATGVTPSEYRSGKKPPQAAPEKFNSPSS